MTDDGRRYGRRLADALASRVRGLTVPVREARPAQPVPAAVQAAVQAALEHGDTHYTSRPGVPGLRAALVTALAAIGLPVGNADTDVVVTAGREEALWVIALSLRTGRVAASAEGLDAEARTLLRLGEVVIADAADVHPDAGTATGGPARLIDLGSRLFTAGARRIERAPPGVWAAFGDLHGVPGLASFRIGFAAGDRTLMAGVRTWKQAFSICTAAPSQQAALAAIAALAPPGASR